LGKFDFVPFFWVCGLGFSAEKALLYAVEGSRGHLDALVSFDAVAFLFAAPAIVDECFMELSGISWTAEWFPVKWYFSSFIDSMGSVETFAFKEGHVSGAVGCAIFRSSIGCFGIAG
jgi:hypothetical protein